MKIITEFKGTYINAKANTGKNGNTYYQISVDCNGDAGSISCTEDVFNLCQSGAVERFHDYIFTGELNTQYGSFRIRDVREQ